MNKLPSVGVAGCGFVGSAVLKGFNLFADVKGYDVDPAKSCNTLEEVLSCSYVFVCLPTPMTCVEGGDCNTKIIDDFFADVARRSLNAELICPDQVFIIKSTVPIGTTKRLSEKYPYLCIVHSPEFLTARTAALDFITPSRNIVGADNEDAGRKVAMLFENRFPGVPVHILKSEESEFVKYCVNTFMTTKVLFFNEMRLLVDKMGLDWEACLDAVMADGRIAKTHYQVPGWDGKRGVGGACFPKDINAFIRTFEANGIDPKILKAVWEQNKFVREDWDWARIKSAVSQ